MGKFAKYVRNNSEISPFDKDFTLELWDEHYNKYEEDDIDQKLHNSCFTYIIPNARIQQT